MILSQHLDLVIGADTPRRMLMANTNPETKVQAPSVVEEAFPPTYASAEEAWDALRAELVRVQKAMAEADDV